MPQYRFIVDNGRSSPEETLFDLLDVEEAKSQAIQSAGEVLADIGLGTVWDGVPWSVTVLDEQAKPVIEIEFTIKGHFQSPVEAQH